MAFSIKNLTSLAQVAVQNRASDIHLRTDEAPCLRINGEMIPVQTKSFSFEDMVDIANILLGEDRLAGKLDEINEMDGGFAIEGLCRIRYNLFRYNQKLGIILRIVNTQIPTIESLGLSKALKKIAGQRRGLILLTGATGSGKSTTLAAMIDEINEHRACHIVTIEDPIEYLHTQKKARISQREVGKDTDNFTTALRSALRQDPDVILIGEMRDPETISTALKAAETGHVVFSTIHTTNAVTSIGRIISMFPPEEQEDVRKRLSENIYATISQRMLKKKAEKGVVIAQEIMVTSPGIKECILGEEPLARITTVIEDGKGPGGNGSQSFDQHIMELYQSGQISKETALSAVSSESDFIQQLTVE